MANEEISKVGLIFPSNRIVSFEFTKTFLLKKFVNHANFQFRILDFYVKWQHLFWFELSLRNFYEVNCQILSKSKNIVDNSQC